MNGNREVRVSLKCKIESSLNEDEKMSCGQVRTETKDLTSFKPRGIIEKCSI